MAVLLPKLLGRSKRFFHEGLQRFPGDQYLLTLESDLGRFLKDKARAIDALTRAFEASPGRAFVAVRLARYQADNGNLERAIDILKRCLAVNPSSHEAHLALAKIMMLKDEERQREEIAYHLKRSFTPGDSNLDAQFWYARHNFLFGDRSVATRLFKDLSNARVAPEHRNRVRDVLKENGAARRYTGNIKAIRDSFCFVSCPDLGADLFAHVTEFSEKDWAVASNGDSVTYEIGFALRGPLAMAVRLGRN